MMIKIRMKNGQSRWIAPRHVCHIGPSPEDDDLVMVYLTSGGSLTVREEMEQLARRINNNITEPPT